MRFKDFICNTCKKTFEEFVKGNEKPLCPFCKSTDTDVNYNGECLGMKKSGSCSGNCKSCKGCH